MDKTPPNYDNDGSWTESPRVGRYHSGGPVTTPDELSDIVNQHERNTKDLSPTSRAVPFAPDPTVGYVPPVTAEPPLGEAPPGVAVSPIGEAPGQPEPPTAGKARPYRRCVVRRACVCLTLQQGAVCIGVMQVAIGVMTLLVEIMYLAGVLVAGSYAMNDDLTGTLPGQEQRWSSMDIAYASLSGVLLLQELILLFFAGLLVHGARMKRPGYVRAWLIFMGLMLAIGVGSWAARLTLEFMFQPSRGGVLLVRCLIFLTPPVYFIIVVRSFYYELLDEIAGFGTIEVEAQPLMKRVPPPYTHTAAAAATDAALDQQAPPLPRKAPLETDLDNIQPSYDDSPSEEMLTDSDNDGGFGEGWLQTSSFGFVKGNTEYPPTKQRSSSDGSRTSPDGTGPAEKNSRSDSGTGARIVAAIGHDGTVQRVNGSSSLPRFKERISNKVEVRSQDYDDDDDDEVQDEVEIRQAPRRLIEVGPRVLPPLPPGHRESLHHVVMNNERKSPPPPSVPTSL